MMGSFFLHSHYFSIGSVMVAASSGFSLQLEQISPPCTLTGLQDGKLLLAFSQTAPLGEETLLIHDEECDQQSFGPYSRDRQRCA